MKNNSLPTDRIILIDKPRGLSSFDVIRVLRKKLGIHKMGHAGTLDPLASGLLLIGIEEGTKKLKDLIGLPKTYEVEILLGKKTETGDMEGKIIEEAEVLGVDAGRVSEVLKSLEGEIEMPVPIYSALKINGVPMYKMARRGEAIEPKKRKMKIFSLKFLGMRRDGNSHIIKTELNCGSGTYARSVAEEVGGRLGYPATVYSLRRTRIGDFKVEDAVYPELVEWVRPDPVRAEKTD